MGAAESTQAEDRSVDPAVRIAGRERETPLGTVIGRLRQVGPRPLAVSALSVLLLTALLGMAGWQGARHLLGLGLLVLAIHCLFLGYLISFQLPLARRTSHVAFLHGLLAFLVVLSGTIGSAPTLSQFLVPYAFGAILATILFGASVAAAVSVTGSLLLGLLHGGVSGPLFLSLALQLVGIFAVRDTTKRIHVVWTGFAVSAVSMALAATFELYGPPFRSGPVAWEVFFGGLAGIFSAAVAIGLLPLFEGLLDVTTVFKIQELSDLDHPLLRNLFIKAPGTYQHSVSVSNLAATAAEAIGANHLLCRVGAYFHDIGKAENPQYFAENEGFGARSRHEDLKPSLSASVIKSHVSLGLKIAREHGLPSAVCDFIPEHHGKSVIRYFYGKALQSQQVGPGAKGEFRYSGPKPRTRETAIVMLADSIDAVSRTLEKPSPSSVEDAVRDTIQNKVLDGDLDESSLSLRDLARIAEAFIKVLNGTFHHRPEYPRPEEIESAERGSTDGGRTRPGGEGEDGTETTPGPEPEKATAT